MRCILHFKHHHSKCPAVFARGIDGFIFFLIPISYKYHCSDFISFSNPKLFHGGKTLLPRLSKLKPARSLADLQGRRLGSQAAPFLLLGLENRVDICVEMFADKSNRLYF